MKCQPSASTSHCLLPAPCFCLLVERFNPDIAVTYPFAVVLQADRPVARPFGVAELGRARNDGVVVYLYPVPDNAYPCRRSFALP